MAYKKNYRKRKRAPRPYRRVYKRRGYKKAAIKTNVRRNLYFFKRKVAPGSMINLSSTSAGVLTFSLNQVAGFTDFTTMFDQYQIAGVKCEFRLILDPSAQSPTSATYPNLYLRKDYDDTNTETIAQIAQDNRSKRFILFPNKARSVYLKPAVQAEYFNQSTGLTIKSPQWNRWIDMTTDTYQHLGLKWCIDTMGVTLPNSSTMSIEYTYYLKMKGTR